MARSIYLFNTHDLPHRAGEMREHQLDLKIPEAVGVDLLSVKTGEIIEVDLRVQSVDEGVLATGRVMATYCLGAPSTASGTRPSFGYTMCEVRTRSPIPALSNQKSL